ncbi:MAG: hypothetical protein P9M14_11650 [Candidatus Alcyoniella australis]|nr:hypothetical protein [Candidatus Alcyoniella australis]
MTSSRYPMLSMTGHFLRARYDRRFLPEPGIWDRLRGRLSELVRFAKLNSPLYADLYSQVDPDDFRLEDLPPLTKEAMMERFDDSLTVRDLTYAQVREFVDDHSKVGSLINGRYMVAHTSGTSGTRGYFVNTLDEWRQSVALSMVPPSNPRYGPLLDQVLSIPIRPFRRWRAITIIATHGHYASPLAYVFSPRFKDYLVDIRMVDLFTPLDELVRFIDEFKPLWIHSYPSVLLALAQEAQAGRLKHRLRIVYGASEPFPNSSKELMQQVWPNVQIDELYGTTEVLPIAKPCEHGHLHWNCDWTIIEPVDEQGEPTPVGEFSHKVYATNLINRTQPVIRYEIGDSLRILPDPCQCGSALPAIEVKGRSNDSLVYERRAGGQGRLLPLSVIATFLEIQGLRQYRVMQTAPQLIEIEFIAEQQDDAARLDTQCREAMLRLLQLEGAAEEIQVEVRQVESIERDRYSGKFKQVQRLF